MTPTRSPRDASEGARVHEIAMRVTFGAPCVGTILGAASECSKHGMRSIAFGAFVLQTTMRVKVGAHRRSFPPRLFETTLATWAAKTGQEFRNAPAPSGITSPKSPRSAPNNFAGFHHEHIQTSELVSSMTGCAMHMEWREGI